MSSGVKAPQLAHAGSFAASTLGSYSQDTSDDSDAGQYYSS
ncbi:hypothetical protein [Nonomuraea diastatica]|nr:hypothetical protein [Nonomuraea diastatica]